MYTIDVLECSKDVIFIVRSKVKAIDGVMAQRTRVVNDERKEEWPVNQILPDRCSVGTAKMQIKTAW